ncbi:MAG: ATP-grasp domain-containing protein [Patescibacteria group bacterium]
MPRKTKKNVIFLITQVLGEVAAKRLKELRSDINAYVFCLSDSEIADCIRLESGKEFQTIVNYMSDKKVDAVVNRGDSLEALYGRLVDFYKVAGTGYKSVLSVKNKANLQKIVEENGLTSARPKTQVVALAEAQSALADSKLPVVVKPCVGAKSRGVIKISRKSQIGPALQLLQHHFTKEKSLINRSLKNKMVLVEEFIEGKQFSCTCFVDALGNLRIINFVDIVNAQELGYKHMQLVFRSSPSQLDEVILQQAKHILQKIVRLAKIKSTCLHPEFFVINRKVLLIEINLRIGGFRLELLKLSTGIDLEKIAVELALGEVIKEDSFFAKNATACEVWSDESGVIKRIELPKSRYTVSQEKCFKPGQMYQAPPMGNRPLAKFFVSTQKDSLAIARNILDRTKLAFQA